MDSDICRFGSVNVQKGDYRFVYLGHGDIAISCRSMFLNNTSSADAKYKKWLKEKILDEIRSPAKYIDMYTVISSLRVSEYFVPIEYLREWVNDNLVERITSSKRESICSIVEDIQNVLNKDTYEEYLFEPERNISIENMTYNECLDIMRKAVNRMEALGNVNVEPIKGAEPVEKAEPVENECNFSKKEPKAKKKQQARGKRKASSSNEDEANVSEAGAVASENDDIESFVYEEESGVDIESEEVTSVFNFNELSEAVKSKVNKAKQNASLSSSANKVIVENTPEIKPPQVSKEAALKAMGMTDREIECDSVKKDIYNMIKEVPVVKTGIIPLRKYLSRCYRNMSDEYGVNWQDEVDRYRRNNNYDSKRKVNMIDVVADSACLQSIMTGIISGDSAQQLRSM